MSPTDPVGRQSTDEVTRPLSQQLNDATSTQQIAQIMATVAEGSKNFPAANQAPVPSQTLVFGSGKIMNRLPVPGSGLAWDFR